MSNPTKDNTSIRVHAPPGGHSNNIFGTPEFEQSAANKKKHMQSNIFGSNNDNNEPAPAAAAAKKNPSSGNNIFGSDLEQAHSKTETLAGQYKQTQMKSSIFGSDEPTTTRTASNKNKSDIFGTANNDEQKKGQAGPRTGHRVGYNPINGEAYGTKEPANGKQPEQQPEKTEQTPEQQPAAENGSAQAEPAAAPSTNDSAQPAAPPATTQNQKPDNANDGNNAQKNVHTSVRVFHPPGGKSNGPLW